MTQPITELERRAYLQTFVGHQHECLFQLSNEELDNIITATRITKDFTYNKYIAETATVDEYLCLPDIKVCKRGDNWGIFHKYTSGIGEETIVTVDLQCVAPDVFKVIQIKTEKMKRGK